MSKAVDSDVSKRGRRAPSQRASALGRARRVATRCAVRRRSPTSRLGARSWRRMRLCSARAEARRAGAPGEVQVGAAHDPVARHLGRARHRGAPGVACSTTAARDPTCALHAEAVSPPSYRHHGGTHRTHESHESHESRRRWRVRVVVRRLSRRLAAGRRSSRFRTATPRTTTDCGPRVYGFAVENNPNDRSELRMRIEGAALERWRAFERFGPGVLFARRAVLRRHGLPRLAPFEETEMETQPTRFSTTSRRRQNEPWAAASHSATPGTSGARSGRRRRRRRRLFTATLRGTTRSRRSTTATTTRREKTSPSLFSGSASSPHRGGAFPLGGARARWQRFARGGARVRRRHGGGARRRRRRGLRGRAGLASVRAHLLNGTEPPGPDGRRASDPWAPVSAMNEARARAVVGGAAAYAAMRAHVESLQPNANEAKGAEENDEKKARDDAGASAAPTLSPRPPRTPRRRYRRRRRPRARGWT